VVLLSTHGFKHGVAALGLASLDAGVGNGLYVEWLGRVLKSRAPKLRCRLQGAAGEPNQTAASSSTACGGPCNNASVGPDSQPSSPQQLTQHVHSNGHAPAGHAQVVCGGDLENTLAGGLVGRHKLHPAASQRRHAALAVLRLGGDLHRQGVAIRILEGRHRDFPVLSRWNLQRACRHHCLNSTARTAAVAPEWSLARRDVQVQQPSIICEARWQLLLR
jgi:hypothetical protein